jgi:hypothetical protein
LPWDSSDLRASRALIEVAFEPLYGCGGLRQHAGSVVGNPPLVPKRGEGDTLGDLLIKTTLELGPNPVNKSLTGQAETFLTSWLVTQTKDASQLPQTQEAPRRRSYTRS